MTQNTENEKSARHELLQAVFDRVQSWQETAPDSTVRAELKKGLDEAGYPDLDEKSFTAMADHIENLRGPADVSTIVEPSALG